MSTTRRVSPSRTPEALKAQRARYWAKLKADPARNAEKKAKAIARLKARNPNYIPRETRMNDRKASLKFFLNRPNAAIKRLKHDEGDYGLNGKEIIFLALYQSTQDGAQNIAKRLGVSKDVGLRLVNDLGLPSKPHISTRKKELGLRSASALHRRWSALLTKTRKSWREKPTQKARSLAYYYANHEANKAKMRLREKNRYEKLKHVPSFRAEKNRRCLAWQRANKARKLVYDRQWRAKNPERHKQLTQAARRRMSADPIHRIKLNLRRRLRGLIRKGKAAHGSHHHDFTGCTRHQLLLHLQSLWQGGMSWANYGTHWHVDHIKPLAAFDLRDEAQCRAAMHYTNLQPLTAEANMRKGAKWAA